MLPAALTGLLLTVPARALDIWTEPNPGVRHLHRTTPSPAEFHALVVDLTAPGVRIRCTPPRERWKSTSAYGRDANLAAAINGGFWGQFGQGAEGLAAGAGTIWSSDDERHGFFAVSATGRAWISPPADVVEAGRRAVTDGVSGRPLIVERGHLAPELYTFPRAWGREPRSVVGVSEDGHRVFLATVDGRRVTSRGGTLPEMAELMVELGAWRAVNLDGGGSTTMYVASEGGVVNRPSRGWEREVINHIGVIAPEPPRPVPQSRSVQETPRDVMAHAEQVRARGHGDVAAGDDTGARGWLRARFGRFMVLDRLHLGKHREVVVPLLWVGLLSAVLSVVFWVVSRVRRRNARRLAARGASRGGEGPGAVPQAQP
ncbi:MAG: phosphodiester glycosidase family protein [Deltaproteobacteria bacterium]|nr:phosphodiester glycosidase family protein [Deltaproteobacteria bacterium]